MSRAAPDPKRNMGEPVPRIEGRLKVTGEALYGSDFPVRNPAFAFFVTSPIAKGRINEIDLADAMAVPGVLDVLTHENTKLNEVKFAMGGGGPTTSWQNLGPDIGHDGQIVAGRTRDVEGDSIGGTNPGHTGNVEFKRCVGPDQLGVAGNLSAVDPQVRPVIDAVKMKINPLAGKG